MAEAEEKNKTAEAVEPEAEKTAEDKAEDTSTEKAVAKKAASKKTATKKAVPKATGHVRTLEERLRGKNYLTAAAKVEVDKEYPVAEAASLVKETSTTKFDGTVEVHVRLGIDARQAEQSVRGTVKLPAGTGKTRKVLAFVPVAKQAEAKKAGADFVGDEATLKKVQDGWTGFDVTVATPDQMAEVGKLGKALGPKGLMPNPKSGTVTEDFATAIAGAKQGTIEFRVAKDATMHAGIGKVSFSADDIEQNLRAYYRAVANAKPDDAKGTFIRSVTIASSMGPGIRISQESLRETAK